MSSRSGNTSPAGNLAAYYKALTVGPSHNYYEGRAQADITAWMEYFCDGAPDSFESVQLRAAEAAGPGAHDQSSHLRRLEPRQRRVLELFHASETINSRDVEKLFGLSQRTARGLLTAWVESGLISESKGFCVEANWESERAWELSDHSEKQTWRFGGAMKACAASTTALVPSDYGATFQESQIDGRSVCNACAPWLDRSQPEPS